ncbi:Putative F0F1-ATPase subunit (ATPase_gene1) [Bremerella volcania]|uniref:F0F1-ATPase subunit (ATPase_gene1) n=1 Tax=Bremerella volcania TaxID=2527984 RepID=A0A518C5Q5_9BACT|nr:AtpZ/AtpI family protein [Bremerella volcania]QDU74534.1 Putative F0F1-ATPase subunit (ATPase_gene1) [Bremerella volcania]
MASRLQADMSPIARAYLWVGRIFSICGEMLVPGLLGYWLDQTLGFEFSIFALIGFFVGLVFGMTHLVLMATTEQKSGSEKDAHGKANQDDSP